LIQLLTLDSWNAIVRVLMKQLPWCWAYFYAYVAVSVFVLMNLVTAIIVENAVKNSNQDMDEAIKAKEKEKRKELHTLETLFKEMDTDGSGTLNWSEFKEAFDDPLMVKKWRLLDFEPDECKELFGLLDDGDGEIETGEFFEGLAKMKGTAQSKDIFRMQKCIDSMMDPSDKSGTKSEAHSHSHCSPDGKKAKAGSERSAEKSECHSERAEMEMQKLLSPFVPDEDAMLIANPWLFRAVQRYLDDLVDGRLASGYATSKTNGLHSEAPSGDSREHGECAGGDVPYVPASVVQHPGQKSNFLTRI